MGVGSLFRELWSGISNAWPPRVPGVPPVTSASGTKVPSNMSANASTATPDASQVSNPDVNTDPLPDDYPIHLMAEARTLYRDRQPPFILNKRSEVSKRCVVPTKEGLRPKFPTMINVVARPWDRKTIFWTVDVNHKRYIVKPFSGGSGGAKYLRWAWPENNFREPPLALSEFSPVNVPPKAPIAYSSSDDEVEIAPNQSKKRSHRAVTADSSSNDEYLADEPNSARINRPRLRESLEIMAPSTTLQPTNNDAESNRAIPQTQHKNVLKQGRKPTRYSELPPRIRDNTSQSPRGGRRRRRTDISTREVSQLYSVTTPAPHLSGKRQNGSAASASQTQAAPRPAPQPPASPIALAEYKQARTTLFVRVAPSSEYQPLKLSECPDLQSFFLKVLGAWGFEGAEVGKVLITFNWMDENDKMRTMFMNPNQEGCYTHLIEEVEDAPCWEDERGKCALDVEIMLRE